MLGLPFSQKGLSKGSEILKGVLKKTRFGVKINCRTPGAPRSRVKRAQIRERGPHQGQRKFNWRVFSPQPNNFKIYFYFRRCIIQQLRNFKRGSLPQLHNFWRGNSTIYKEYLATTLQFQQDYLSISRGVFCLNYLTRPLQGVSFLCYLVTQLCSPFFQPFRKI